MCLLGPKPWVWRGVSVLCVGALRWGICLKGLVVARLTCLCLDFVLCCWTILGLWDSCACFVGQLQEVSTRFFRYLVLFALFGV